MSEQCTPRPGEIWRYECPMIGDRIGVVDATGRATVIDGDNDIPKTARPVELIGYTARYDALAESRAEVEKLRVAVDDATSFYHQALEERDEYRAEVERLRADLDSAAYRAGQTQGELGAALAAVERVWGWYGTVRYALTPHQQGQFVRALDGGERDE